MKTLEFLFKIISGCIISFALCFQTYASGHRAYQILNTQGMRGDQRCNTFITNEDDDFRSKIEEIKYIENAFYFSCSIHGDNDTPNAGKGDHVILKARDKNKYIIITRFNPNIFSNGLSVNDKINIPIRSDRHLSNWFAGVNQSHTLAYTYTGLGDSGMITDSITNDSKTYRGTDGHGVTVKVRIPMGQWFAYSIEIDSAGIVRDRQFSPDIYKYMHNIHRIDAMFAPIKNYLRDSYIEAFAHNPVVHAMLVLLLFKNRHTVFAGTTGAIVAAGKAMQAISSGGVFLVGGAYHSVNYVFESLPATSAMNFIYIYNSGMTTAAMNYLSRLLPGGK
ncbi:MAG: hypothetical protein QS721_03985 [Candidatus Endonucleobacter sp. (ex Gigantidas childressi)]|nr:hypothetical protein [Candidatus Endonucleobacter sp. (ex Gigantidas childressi)]